MPDERWRPIAGHKGYEASSLGRVRSVPRTLRDGRTAGGVVLALQRDRNGYLTAGLGRKRVRVSIAVLLAFQGPPEARHLNDMRDDNRPENLAWGSRLENERDKKRNRRREGIEVIGTGSRPEEIATEPVTPVTGLVKLSEAVRLGIISGSLGAARKARWNGNGFPDAAGHDGLACLYDAQALAAWDAGRRGRAD